MTEKKQNRQMVVGLTGNTGSGKTTVAKLFESLGAVIIDADQIGRKALDHHEKLREQVISVFGKSITDDNGAINRKRLGAMIFSDPEKKTFLNTLIYPYLWPEVRKRIEEQKKTEARLIVVDAALIFEAGIESWFDAIIVVAADPEICMDRIMMRDGISRTDARNRMNSQINQDDKIEKADHVILNDKQAEELNDKIRKVYGLIMKDEE